MPEAFVQEISHHERWDWEDPFQVFAQVVARAVAAAQAGHRVGEAWRRAADALADKGRSCQLRTSVCSKWAWSLVSQRPKWLPGVSRLGTAKGSNWGMRGQLPSASPTAARTGRPLSR